MEIVQRVQLTEEEAIEHLMKTVIPRLDETIADISERHRMRSHYEKAIALWIRKKDRGYYDACQQQEKLLMQRDNTIAAGNRLEDKCVQGFKDLYSDSFPLSSASDISSLSSSTSASSTTKSPSESL